MLKVNFLFVMSRHFMTKYSTIIVPPSQQAAISGKDTYLLGS